MPLARTARPDEARTGSRRNWTTLPAMFPTFQGDGGGGGESAIGGSYVVIEAGAQV
jgi:hypothetical protein